MDHDFTVILQRRSDGEAIPLEVDEFIGLGPVHILRIAKVQREEEMMLYECVRGEEPIHRHIIWNGSSHPLDSAGVTEREAGLVLKAGISGGYDWIILKRWMKYFWFEVTYFRPILSDLVQQYLGERTNNVPREIVLRITYILVPDRTGS